MTLPVVLRKATPTVSLLGLALILTGCNSEQVQKEQFLPTAHSASTTYGQSAMALPQNLRHYQRTPRAVRIHHHATPPADVLSTGY